MDRIGRGYNRLCWEKSDIQEHLPTLARYASECSHITEFGVRTGLSTTALLYWKPKTSKLVSYDIESCLQVEQLLKITREDRVDRTFIKWDTKTINIEETDMLFIDTRHIYDLLKIELERHAYKVKKYIIMHDTTSYWEVWEVWKWYTCTKTKYEGLNKAIKEFLERNIDWKTKEVFTNNNWLTILERTSPLIKKERVFKKKEKTSNTVVFTAIYWDKDILKKQPKQSIPVDWVCFTDSPNLECEEWAREQRDIRVLSPHKHLHPRMQAKYFRTHPYDYIDSGAVMYMDWSARLLRSDSVAHFVWQMLDKSDILTFQHPERNCIVDEANFCSGQWQPQTIDKYKGLPMREQVERYISKWFPKNYGLTWTGLLIHKRGNSKTVDFLQRRWTECLEWGYQDQLCFDPLVYFLKIHRQRLQENLWKNDYITFLNPHKNIW